MTDRSEAAFRALDIASAGRLRTRVSSTHLTNGPVLHAVDHKGARLLLIPVAQEDPVVDDHSSSGVFIRTMPIDLGDPPVRPYVVISCEKANLQDLFASLCDDMLDTLADSAEQPAGPVCVRVLDRWRDLLTESDDHLLGIDALTGLIAELHLLEDLARIAPGRAIASWTGPHGARFDFTGPNAIEVKATTTRERITVRINGITQLQPPDDGLLHLCIERLERVPTGGDSLRDLVGRLAAAGVPGADLYRSLAQLGVAAVDLPAYDTVRFATLDRWLFQVDDAFPLLTPASFLDPVMVEQRISGISYVVDLTVAPPDPVPSRDRESVLRGLLSMEEPG